MRCKTCDYRLWNLPSRACPECGTPFLPSDYEFVPNSVQFCCPHCGQAYYGTGLRGHLEPPEFDCVNCAAHLHMDEMVLRPAEGVMEAQTAVERLPWADRRGLSRTRAWGRTIGMTLFKPGRVMRLALRDATTQHAWSFAIVNLLLIWLGHLAGGLLLTFFISGRTLPRFSSQVAPAMCGVSCVIGIAMLAYLTLEGLVTHGVLRLTGGARGRMSRTFQAVCYSSGALIPVALPCFGFYLGVPWWLISASIMVKEGHGVGSLRAVIATLLLPVLTVAAFVALYVMAFSNAVSSGTPTGTWSTPAMVPASSRVIEMERVLGQVRGYAQQHNGQGPAHALVLVDESRLQTFDLFSIRPSNLMKAILPAQMRLMNFSVLPAKERRRVVRKVIAALPPNTVAHRLGDYVFTYHGIDLRQPDPRLWVVILWPESSGHPQAGVRTSLVVGLADGSVRESSVFRADGYLRESSVSLASDLAEQNRLRAAYGLPPLPNPADVHQVSLGLGGRAPSPSRPRTQPSVRPTDEPPSRQDPLPALP